MRQQYELAVTTEGGKKLKNAMITGKGLSKVFCSEFEVQFLDTPEDRIIYLAEPVQETKVHDALVRMLGIFDGGGHVSKEYVRMLASPDDVIPPDGLSTKFAGAANQNTPSEKASKGFSPRTEKQKLQAELIDANDIIFSIGPAGTGKTHVAMAKAVEALKSGKVKKILLTRPATAAGEDLGFLPGTKDDKLAPYMRPLYDELDKAYGPGKYQKMLADGIVEIAPIGFMRGRTFEDSFIVIDEAQNCTWEHLKMAITRLGPGSKMVITGDPEQSDLKTGQSGLKPMYEALQGVERVACQFYEPGDVVRHPTVKRIIDKLEGEKAQKQPVNEPKGP